MDKRSSKWQISVSAFHNQFPEIATLAQQYQLGIELATFANPNILDTNWQSILNQYQTQLESIHPLSVHGPFFDLSSGSPDKRITQLTKERYQHAIRICREIEASPIVFHTNFLGFMKNDIYRTQWLKQNIVFWEDLADYARQHDVTINLENMWDQDPTILHDLVSAVNSPNLRICLDIAHVYVFGDSEIPVSEWIESLHEWIVELHINNNDGIVDSHEALNYKDGVINYEYIFELIDQYIEDPLIVLEMNTLATIRESLAYMQIFPV